MEDEYIIINKTTIQKRIEELEDRIKNDGLFLEEIQHYKGQIFTLKQIISQSTPLIPEIQNGIYAGYKFARQNFYNADNTLQPKVQEYISNLKLDI